VVPSSKPKAPTQVPTIVSSSPDICNSSSTGSFGIVTSDSLIVSYDYQMQVSPSADTSGLANKMELAITKLVWPSISSCNNTIKRILQSNSTVKVFGLSYLPKDFVSGLYLFAANDMQYSERYDLDEFSLIIIFPSWPLKIV
jgi:hypothetical protein